MQLKFRIILNVKNDVLRDIIVDSSISLIEFSNIISSEFGFDSSEISTFHHTDENWEQLEEIKIFKIDDQDKIMDNVSISNFFIAKDDKLIFIYDFLNYWTFFVELYEVGEFNINDKKYLLPDPIMTLKAAEKLIKNNFKVLPYINSDPELAKNLEGIGCSTVMPLASPIGSGNGINNEENIKIIIEQSKVPVVVDAGLAVPSDAARMMEIGADAVLVNTAIAESKVPKNMGKAFKLGVEAGRISFSSGRIPAKQFASASSPKTNLINS